MAENPSKTHIQTDQLKAIFDAAAHCLADAKRRDAFAERHGMDSDEVVALAEKLSLLAEGKTGLVLTGRMDDWHKKECPEELEPEWDIPHRLNIDLCSFNQPYIEITPVGAEKNFSANMFIEINKGRPAIHAGVSYDDNVAHIHFLEDGIEVVPDAPMDSSFGTVEAAKSMIYKDVECIRFKGEVF